MKENFVQNKKSAETVKKIKRYMFQKGMYQSEFAERIGISRTFLSYVITGNANFSERTIYKIETYINENEDKDTQ